MRKTKKNIEAKVLTEQDAFSLLKENTEVDFQSFYEKSAAQGELVSKVVKKGIDRIRRTNPENAQDRLDYVLEIHPDLSPEKITTPVEIYDIIRLNKLYKNVDDFPKIQRNLMLTVAGITGAILLRDYNQDPENISKFIEYSKHIATGLTYIPILDNIRLLAKQGVSIIKGKIGKKFYSPLSEKEERFANYVYLREKHN